MGQSESVLSMNKLIDRVATTRTNVLVIGESGTGKELVARRIHDHSPLKNKPFIPVNCGAIPENLIESELFGHKKGSFTGAVAEKMGLFEAANHGTIFLDEVGELPLSMQVKLLRVIQERSFRKVGGTDDVHVDVRIIAATNRNLEEAVRQGTFREDLYYRLNVILIRTPPLRERAGDVRLLAKFFLEQFAQKFSKSTRSFAPGVLEALDGYGWPGNVRELENVIERAIALESSEEITLQSLPITLSTGMRSAPATPAIEIKKAPVAAASGSDGRFIQIPAPDFSKGKVDLDEILGGVEKTFLLHALEHTGGVKKKAADLLGITFRSIRYRLKKQKIKD